MTKITFFRQNGVFWGFQETGHAGFGEEGDDILCAALSAMTMLILNTVEVAYKTATEYTIDDVNADIRVTCKKVLTTEDEKIRFAVSGLFEGYYYQLVDLTEEYFEFLDVELLDV
ncbi:MAG: ribosomal-processing cysteine protease Prp [Ruminococcaceae bacterium]|nr:ribosomal-processing cysteine protease Prp [Oscillospiraceae bacterium]